MGRRESDRRSLLDHVQTCLHRVSGVAEVEHPSVAQPPDRAPAPAAGDVLHEESELSGDIGRESIAALLGQPGVPGEIHEADRRRLRDVALDPLGLQRGLHMVHGVLGPRMDSVSPVHHDEHLLQRRGDAVAELGSELDQLSLGHAGRSRALLDMGFVEVDLRPRERA